jgi:hypothetical protein
MSGQLQAQPAPAPEFDPATGQSFAPPPVPPVPPAPPTPGANGAPPPNGGTGKPRSPWREVNLADPCLFCEATAGCKIREDDSVAACLNRATGQKPIVANDGTVYCSVFDARAIRQEREERRVKEVQRFLSLLFPPEEGHVYELRVLEIQGRGRPRQASGYFDDAAKAAKAAMKYDTVDCLGIYVVVNPVKPDCLPRGPNKIIDYAKKTTSEKEVLRYRWLVIDCDPERPSGVPATNEQLDAALSFAARVKALLTTRFHWPEPVEGMSGNGAYLLYKVDLPSDDTTKQLIAAVLKAIKPLLEAADREAV